MNYPTHDTQWALSQKGNWWRRENGVALIVGKRKDGRFWARRGEEFLPGSFLTVEEAKRCLDLGASDKDGNDADYEWRD